MILDNKTIFITGGTGSFGKKFIEIVLKYCKPKAIRIFSRDELKQFQMQQEFKDKRIRYLIGDVRDKNRVYRAIEGVDIVVHAAALKQVPACEYNPSEAIKTNIIGGENIIEAAIDNNVEKVIALSTDKAVNPVNLYGATKLCAEKLFIQSNTFGKGKTKISCVRYGNVAGSRGSVIPVFLEQKEKGKTITITDAEMTRFWITQEQAVRFIINCIETMHGGEIFIPKIPSMKITDLAQVIAPEIKTKIIGIRPGEKIHETLLPVEEAKHSKEFDKYFIIEPEHSFWKEANFKDGKTLPDEFRYASDTNNRWLIKEQMQEILKNFKIEK